MSPAIIKATNNENKGVLEYEGSNFLRARLVLATLSGRPIRIRQIRTKEGTGFRTWFELWPGDGLV